MNFLEQVAAEWYGFSGYFTRTNIKIGKLTKGGFGGEIDVLAVMPKTSRLVHVETSMDALSWTKRRQVFDRKFEYANRYYKELVGFLPASIERIAVVGWAKTYPEKVFAEAEFSIRLIPSFFNAISEELSQRDPMREAIPEAYPTLRALQFAAFSLKLAQKKS